MVIASGLYTILGFALMSENEETFMFDIIPHIYVGDFELNDFWRMVKIFYTTRLYPRSLSSIALL